MSSSQRLGDVMVAAGAVGRPDVESAAIEARATAKRLGEVLIERGLLSERDVYRYLAKQHGLRFLEADEVFPLLDLAVARTLPKRFSERAGVVPLTVIEGVAAIVTSDPYAPLHEIGDALHAHRVDACLVTPTDLTRIRTAVDLGQVHEHNHDHDVEIAPDLLAQGSLTAELVSVFDALLLDAIAERASDIHLEIYGGKVRVRLRVDGDLHDAPRYQLSARQLAGVINVLKVRANLDIAERRLPQGGRFTTRAGGHIYDIRVQTQPAMHGEHAILRLLPQEQSLISIEELGFDDDVARAYRRLLQAPAGLILVVGPTGSGKSTTLYSGLKVLTEDPTRKVITVEDPIEYALDGIQQTQVKPEIGFAFADAMRAFVREDPDVILVGEIRDGETALEALRASQTGHLVLSTLHCNDAVDAVQRLRDLGMHPNSISSELLAVFAQRLAKRICSHCRVPSSPNPTLVAEVFPDGLPEGFSCWKGQGCEACRGRGTHGRVAVVEHLPASAGLRRAIGTELPLDDVRDIAVQAGLVPMREAALRHVVAGTIAFDELLQLLPPERLAPPPNKKRMMGRRTA